jgi:hypothetical protein
VRQRRFHHGLQFLGIARLDQEVEGPATHSLDAFRDEGAGGEDDDGRAYGGFLGLAEDGESVFARHAQVAHDQIETSGFERANGLLPIGGLGHTMSQAFDGAPDDQANLGFIVDN